MSQNQMILNKAKETQNWVEKKNNIKYIGDSVHY